MIIDKVVNYLVEQHMSVSAFEKKCGLGNGVVRGWKDGNPSIKTLQKMEKATGIPIAEWVKE